MGPVNSHYAGSFYCKRCWDVVDAADPAHKKGGSGSLPAAKYNYEVVIPRCHPKKARLLERNEDRTWKVKYVSDKAEEDNIPENALVPDTKDCVDSIEKLKTMLHSIFSDIPSDHPQHLMLASLNDHFSKRGQRIDPKKIGHTNLASLMRDDRLCTEFGVSGGIG